MPISVISTIHPAAILRQPGLEKSCIRDWVRIAREAQEGWQEPLVRQHHINPTPQEVEDYLNALTPEDVVAIDIEAWDGVIRCVGFAKSATESLVVPTTGKGKEDMWTLVKEICQHPCEKVGQNFHFDQYWLYQLHGILVKNWEWDTLAMAHCLDSSDRYGLEYLASIYTRQTAWKSLSSDADDTATSKFNKMNLDDLYRYNGLDCCVTRELFDELHTMLSFSADLDFYHEHYSKVFRPLLSMMCHGITMDVPGMSVEHERLVALQLSLRDKAGESCGFPLFTMATKLGKDMQQVYYTGGEWPENYKEIPKERYQKTYAEMQTKGISDAHLLKALVETFGMKLGEAGEKATQGGRVSLDNVSIKRLINKVKAYKGHREKWDRVEELLVTVLAFRRAQKIASFIKPEKVDNDGRMRCQYKFTTITGRLASSENPCRSGQNLQNIDRSLKGLFLPDKGCVLLEADLSRAENRIVLCLTGDAELIRKARRMPDEGDDYREAGAAIYSRLLKRTVAPEELSNEQRYASKRVVLASGYGMTGRKLSDLFLKDGYAYTAKECDGFIDAYMDANPAILQWQKETRLYVARNRRLFNSWGRDIHFEFERMDDELFRRSYAWVPQGEVGELTKCWGVRDTYYWLRENKLKTKMNMTVHDSLVMSCPVEELYDVAKYIDVNFSRPRTYGAHLGRSVELAIPCEYKIGLNWKGEKSWMRLPQREEIEEQARLMLRAL